MMSYSSAICRTPKIATKQLCQASLVQVKRSSQSRRVQNFASNDSGSTAQLAIGVTGCVCNPIIWASLKTLYSTGSGLPPGPGGILGALEGVSYLVMIGIVAWSLKTKADTGSGLPAGPGGLLGGAEGLSFLSAAASVVVFGLTFVQRGGIPGPLG